MPSWWNQRARGLGAMVGVPISTGGEENLRCLSSDRYRGDDIFFHEASHSVAVSYWRFSLLIQFHPLLLYALDSDLKIANSPRMLYCVSYESLVKLTIQCFSFPFVEFVSGISYTQWICTCKQLLSTPSSRVQQCKVRWSLG